MAKREFTVAREGFLMSTYRKVGDKVTLHPRQATYLIHGGQIAHPAPRKSVTEQAAEIFAAAEAAKTAPAAPAAATAPDTKASVKA